MPVNARRVCRIHVAHLIMHAKVHAYVQLTPTDRQHSGSLARTSTTPVCVGPCTSIELHASKSMSLWTVPDRYRPSKASYHIQRRTYSLWISGNDFDTDLFSLESLSSFLMVIYRFLDFYSFVPDNDRSRSVYEPAK